jgi:hypothetical protein
MSERLIDCPECHEPKLVRLIGMGSIPIIKGTTTPCRGEKKRKIGDKLGQGKNKGEKPFWRDGPINKKILKNPEKYIKKGEVD